MVAYSFQTRFVDPILSGRKRQTLRGDRRRHARPGEELQLYTGMRTRHCCLIGRAPCVAVAQVEIVIGLGTPAVFLDAAHERQADPQEFARADGFADWADFEAYWLQDLGPGAYMPWMIQWAELRSAL